MLVWKSCPKNVISYTLRVVREDYNYKDTEKPLKSPTLARYLDFETNQ